MENFTLFIIEDDPWYGEILTYHLSLNPDYEVHKYSSAQECLQNLHKKPDLITIDYSLPDMDGGELMKKLRSHNPDLPVIVISAQENVATAVELLRSGANEYFIKDDNTIDLVWKAVVRIRETQALKQEVAQLREELGKHYEFEKVVKGSSSGMKKVFSLMEKAAQTNINVSISGETGTGKEVVAKAIHYNSDKKKKAFVAVNMAAIPKELLESELFGHEKGAFTGAVGRKTGKFEEAGKGTLFLDEIAEMDINLQSKLLRVLQERELVRVGGNEVVKLEFRLIVATHKNLAEEVRKGTFREDLYFRIMGLPIALPALRERGEDIVLLAKYFLSNFCSENKLPAVTVSKAAMEKLMGYAYPGNIRELKAVVELAAVMCNYKEILPTDISFMTSKGANFLMGQERTLKEYTINIIEHFLEKYDNNVLKVADKLDIGKSTVYKMIQNKEINIGDREVKMATA